VTGARLRAGSAADWASCWAMDVAYTTDHVWQLQVHPLGESRSAALTRVRLPRPITLKDPLWGGEPALAQFQTDGALVVAERDGGSVGFAVLLDDHARNVSAMPMLAVSPYARRQGIGTMLLAECVASAQTRARRALTVTVPARNDPAILFLQRAGFAMAGYDEQYYAANDVAVFFAYRLRGGDRGL